MNKNIDFIDPKKEQKENRTNSLIQFLTGNVLTSRNVVNQLPFVLFLTGLAIIYIANRYHAEKMARQTMTLKEEVKELRAEATTLNAKLMKMSRQSQVVRLVRKNDLQLYQLTKPPRKIEIEAKD